MGFDLIPFIKSIGYLGILASVLLENGVIICFFMPSDSLLFATGFLASQGVLDLYLVIGVCFTGAVLGYMLGYWMGYKSRLRVFRDGDTRLLKRRHFEKADRFYAKYGKLALVVARFFPVRAFVSFLAGASGMSYPTFMLYNVLSALVWATSLTLMGFYFGRFLAPEEFDFLFVVITMAALVILFCTFLYFYIRHEKKIAEREEGG